jgi:D-psicose/D-tagatose/L-ribulose 3-epimerase
MDAAVTEIAPRVKAMGFDLLELGVENSGDWDPPRRRDPGW